MHCFQINRNGKTKKKNQLGCNQLLQWKPNLFICNIGKNHLNALEPAAKNTYIHIHFRIQIGFYKFCSHLFVCHCRHVLNFDNLAINEIKADGLDTRSHKVLKLQHFKGKDIYKHTFRNTRLYIYICVWIYCVLKANENRSKHLAQNIENKRRMLPGAVCV